MKCSGGHPPALPAKGPRAAEWSTEQIVGAVMGARQCAWYLRGEADMLRDTLRAVPEERRIFRRRLITAIAHRQRWADACMALAAVVDPGKPWGGADGIR